MFEEAIRYPWKGEKHVESMAIGGILTLFVLPMILVFGYAVRVVREVSAGNVDTPPVFDEWGELLVDGLKVVAVMVVYGLVSFGVIALAALSLILPVSFSEGGSAGASSLNALGVVLALVVVIVAVVVAIGAAYLLPAAIAAVAQTGRVTAAFSPAGLRSIGGHRGYAVAWLVALALTILADVVSGVAAMTVVGAILVPFVTFYGTVAAAYAIGKGVSDRPTVEDGESVPTTGGSTA